MPRNLTIKKSFWQKGFSNSALFLKANIHQKPQFRQLDGTTKAKLQHGYNRLLRLATAVCCGAAPVRFGHRNRGPLRPKPEPDTYSSDTGIGSFRQKKNRILTHTFLILHRNFCYRYSIYFKNLQDTTERNYYIKR